MINALKWLRASLPAVFIFLNGSANAQMGDGVPPEWHIYDLEPWEEYQMLDNVYLQTGMGYLFQDTVLYEARDTVKHIVQSGEFYLDWYRYPPNINVYCKFMKLEEGCLGKSWAQESEMRRLLDAMRVTKSKIIRTGSMLTFIDSGKYSLRRYEYHLDTAGKISYALGFEYLRGAFALKDSTVFNYNGKELQKTNSYYLKRDRLTGKYMDQWAVDTSFTETTYKNGRRETVRKYQNPKYKFSYKPYEASYKYDETGRLKSVFVKYDNGNSYSYRYTYEQERLKVFREYVTGGYEEKFKLYFTFKPARAVKK